MGSMSSDVTNVSFPCQKWTKINLEISYFPTLKVGIKNAFLSLKIPEIDNL